MSDAIKKFTKIDASEAKTLDRSKMGVSMVSPEVGEVEGQDMVYIYVSCPCRGDVTRLLYDTDAYHWYTCGVCGCQMRA